MYRGQSCHDRRKERAHAKFRKEGKKGKSKQQKTDQEKVINGNDTVKMFQRRMQSHLREKEEGSEKVFINLVSQL